MASGQPRLGESCGDGGYARARDKMKCGESARVERCGEARLGGERCGEARLGGIGSRVKAVVTRRR